MRLLRIVSSVAILILGCQHSFASWPYFVHEFVFMSPVIADVDGNGTLEIVFGAENGKLYCLKSDGTPLWIVPLSSGTNDQLRSTPTIYDLDDDGRQEIIVGYRGIEGGKLFVLRGSDGGTLAKFIMQTGVEAPVLVCDLEHDGIPEIVVGQWNGLPIAQPLYCLSANLPLSHLSLVPKWITFGRLARAPAAADIDNDGREEVFLAPSQPPPLTDFGSVKMFSYTGQGGWRSPSLYWGGTTFAIVDINSDGNLEIVNVQNIGPGRMECRDAITGDLRWSVGYEFYTHHHPAIADFDGDGQMEIIVGHYDPGDRLLCIDSTGLIRWDVPVVGRNVTWASPSIGDLDGDGVLEIVLATANPGAAIQAIDGQGRLIWSRSMPGEMYSSPALADLDGDGTLEIAFGCSDNRFYVVGFDGQDYVAPPVLHPPDLMPWPTFRQNNQRTGTYIRP